MPEGLEKTKKFLRELQRSDRQRKKRWLVGLTAVTMALVLLLWSVYINATGLPALAQKPAASPAAEGRSTWEVFRKGLSEIFTDAKEQLELSKNLIQGQIQKTNEIVIDATSTATTTPEPPNP